MHSTEDVARWSLDLLVEELIAEFEEHHDVTPYLVLLLQEMNRRIATVN